MRRAKILRAINQRFRSVEGEVMGEEDGHVWIRVTEPYWILAIRARTDPEGSLLTLIIAPKTDIEWLPDINPAGNP